MRNVFHTDWYLTNNQLSVSNKEQKDNNYNTVFKDESFHQIEYFLSGERCLEFYYNMFGREMGTLNVYLAVGGQPGSPIWTLSGDQGFAWKKATLTVNHIDDGQVRLSLHRQIISKFDSQRVRHVC